MENSERTCQIGIGIKRCQGSLGCFCLLPSINIEAVSNLESDGNASTVGWLAAQQFANTLRISMSFRWV